MLAALDLMTRVAIAVGLVIVAAWAIARLFAWVIRLRGPIWHAPQSRRGIRIVETWSLALGLAVAGVVACGWLAARLGAAPWTLAVPAAAVCGWTMWRLASAFQATIRLGETLLAGRSPEEPMEDLPSAPPATPGRRIVVLCDGTANRPPEKAGAAATNVWKIGQALVHDETQVVWYDAGVATGTSRVARGAATLERIAGQVWLKPLATVLGVAGQVRTTWEAMTGTGVSENVLEAYVELARQYRPGDRIYIMGFSRGAYTARALAGVVRSCGLLKASNLRYAPAVLSLYLARRGFRRNSHRTPGRVPVADEFAWHRVPIEMLGVFDTVASLGAPLWGWWFQPRGVRNRELNTNPVPNVRHVYHALAMDERRATFFPTLFWKAGGARSGWTETLEQVWFRGAHADIGGGYEETGLSDITLGWMLERCVRHGLNVRPKALEALKPDPLARLHDETARRPSWSWIGTWPRWAKVLDDAPTKGAGIAVHPSVFERARRVLAETGRHDLYDLAPGETVAFRAEAHRQWDRTGLVIRGGGDVHYRLRWVGGRWRDSSCPPCGPGGNLDGDRPGDPRYRLRRRRRVHFAPWMTLCATVATPRRWPLRELPLRLAFGYLFRREPRLLLNQLAPLGMDLDREGGSILIRSDRPPGLLYLFANDLWQTYSNNSGELLLELTRIDGPPSSGEVVWVLPRNGRWRRITQAVSMISNGTPTATGQRNP